MEEVIMTRRPYCCEICGKGFKRRDHLVRHFNCNHSKLRYLCDVCNLSYCRRERLRRHMKKIHGDDIPAGCPLAPVPLLKHTFLIKEKHNISPTLPSFCNTPGDELTGRCLDSNLDTKMPTQPPLSLCSNSGDELTETFLDSNHNSEIPTPPPLLFCSNPGNELTGRFLDSNHNTEMPTLPLPSFCSNPRDELTGRFRDSKLDTGMSTKSPLPSKENYEGDAADFLLTNCQYHDCFFTVGNPESDAIEKIGVPSLYLIANSPVFRTIFENGALSDPLDTSTHITDVSPETFKLMLRYIYGGKLKKMPAVEAAKLALCAEKFKIPRLVCKALKQLHPTCSEDVFSALVCVTCTNTFPDLESHVTKIIQQDTDKVVKSAEFLELTEDAVLFIVKQDVLNISEVELWHHIVRWGKYQLKTTPEITIRNCLSKILGYVRFLTLTLDEILEHVLPTQVLTYDEFIDLTLAIKNKCALQTPTLCKIEDRRKLIKTEKENSKLTMNDREYKTQNGTSVVYYPKVKSEIPDLKENCFF